MKKSKAQILADAKTDFEHHDKILKIHEALWQQKWDAAQNPFISWREYMEDEQQRSLIVKPWVKARDYYNSLPKPKKQVNAYCDS